MFLKVSTGRNLAAFLFATFLMIPSVFAQRGAGSTTSISPSGVTGTAGVGFADYTVFDPDSQNMRFDQGQFAALTAERGFGFMNLYLNLSLSYIQATGQTNYDYTSVNEVRYTATDVNFKSEVFQTGLGLKLKLIDGYWFRPYIEGGGTGGFFKIKYSNLNDTKVTSSPAGNDEYKKEDNLLDFGKYAEGGLEVQFSDMFGVRAAARFVESRTKKFTTLANNEINYRADIYYFSLLVAF